MTYHKPKKALMMRRINSKIVYNLDSLNMMVMMISNKTKITKRKTIKKVSI